ncbi:RNA-binding S4 domain-containing protein [Streptomyces sp. NPDC058001]|uniref:RNA-binding S4 domain-containing protein n=1 Tax=Streptomyces sp. NPDC058001 TaxID=3346300 RepID=UPI0036EE5F58
MAGEDIAGAASDTAETSGGDDRRRPGAEADVDAGSDLGAGSDAGTAAGSGSDTGAGSGATSGAGTSPGGTVAPDPSQGSVRVDSWIWSVRLVKTRSMGATACRGGHVRVNGERVKPAYAVRVGDEVRLRHGGRERIVVVKRVIRKRVGPPVAVECYVDNSPPPPPREAIAPAGVRDRGAGRPTKRDRREMERLRGVIGPGGPTGTSGTPRAPGTSGVSGAPAEPRRRRPRTPPGAPGKSSR